MDPLVMLRIDCRCRRVPETRSSWSKIRFLLQISHPTWAFQGKSSEMIQRKVFFVNRCYLYVSWATTINFGIQIHSQTGFGFSMCICLRISLESSIQLLIWTQNLVFDQEDLVSGSLRYRQSIRSTVKRVPTNFQSNRSSLSKIWKSTFYLPNCHKISWSLTSARGATFISLLNIATHDY